MDIKAEYLNFTSFDEIKQFEDDILSMPVDKAKKRVQGLLATRSIWNKIFLWFGYNDYDKAKLNGPIGFENKNDVEYISIKEYNNLLVPKSLLINDIPYDEDLQKDNEDLQALIVTTGFDNVMELSKNLNKIKILLNPIKSFFHSTRNFFVYADFTNNSEVMNFKLFQRDFNNLAYNASIIYTMDISQDIKSNLKTIISGIDQCINTKQFDYHYKSLCSQLLTIARVINNLDYEEKYNVIKDSGKEKEISQKQNEIEQLKDKTYFDRLPKLISEKENTILKLNEQVESLEKELNTITDYSEKAEIYKQLSLLMEKIKSYTGLLKRDKTTYSELNNKHNFTGESNKHLI
jgi:hypothetical protein